MKSSCNPSEWINDDDDTQSPDILDRFNFNLTVNNIIILSAHLNNKIYSKNPKPTRKKYKEKHTKNRFEESFRQTNK